MLDDTLVRLEKAKGTGEPDAIGEAHLAMVAALGEAAAGTGESGQADLYDRMLEHAEEAVAAYEGAGPGWRLAEAHLLEAALLAHRAQGGGAARDEGEWLACVTGALDHCHRAALAMQEAGEQPYAIAADWHAAAGGVLLTLRELIEGVQDEEPRRALDGLLTSYSEILGASLAGSLERRSEGIEQLFAARLLDVLAAAEEDPAERREMAAAGRELAAGALADLRDAGDLALAQEAYRLIQEED